jgi:hypothetical protein
MNKIKVTVVPSTYTLGNTDGGNHYYVFPEGHYE